MNDNRTWLLCLLFVSVFMLGLVEPSVAQCPMCRASAETSIKQGSTAAKGLNTGILYLFSAPYLLLGTLGFFWYRGHKKNREHLLGTEE